MELDTELTITMHVQAVDQTRAIKMIKGKLSDIDKMKVEEQVRVARRGYDRYPPARPDYLEGRSGAAGRSAKPQ